MNKDDLEQLERQRHNDIVAEMNLRHKRQDFEYNRKEWQRLSNEEREYLNAEENNSNIFFHSILSFIVASFLSFLIYRDSHSYIYSGLCELLILAVFIFFASTGRLRVFRWTSFFIASIIISFEISKILNKGTYFFIILVAVSFFVTLLMEFSGWLNVDASPKWKYTSPGMMFTSVIFILLVVILVQLYYKSTVTNTKNSQTIAERRKSTEKKDFSSILSQSANKDSPKERARRARCKNTFPHQGKKVFKDKLRVRNLKKMICQKFSS